MSYRVVANDRFRAQLDEIEHWIAEQRDPATAVAIGDEILERCARLADFPNRGTPHSEIRPGLRTIPHRGRFTIGYLVDGDTVTIVGVAGPGQRLRAITGDDAEAAAR